MVEAVRNGLSQREVARQFGVSLLTVQRWLKRAQDKPLDTVDFRDHAHNPHQVANRTAGSVEEQVLALRQELAKQSDLGEYGAHAIHREMIARHAAVVPCVRTINRILARHGVFDGKRRVRRPAPPPGWYLPDVAGGQAELEQVDAVLGLCIEGGTDVEVLNLLSLHGGLVASWPAASVTAELTRRALLEHWRHFGLPTYVQFDNDARFQGPHQHPGAIGTVIRMCLSLAVTPVFAPTREMGFQAAIESYNNRWQQKVWQRFHHESLPALQAQSARYVAAARKRSGLRQEASPARREFPSAWTLNLKAHVRGQIIFLRRTDEQGQAHLLGETFAVAAHWLGRLVRCEVNIETDQISFYALRRSAPGEQPLLKKVEYRLPSKHAAD